MLLMEMMDEFSDDLRVRVTLELVSLRREEYLDPLVVRDDPCKSNCERMEFTLHGIHLGFKDIMLGSTYFPSRKLLMSKSLTNICTICSSASTGLLKKSLTTSSFVRTKKLSFLGKNVVFLRLS